MAEPFSTAAAGIALLSNLKHLYIYLKDLKDSIKSVHDDVDALQKEVLSVQELSESIEQLRDRLHRRPSSNAEQMKQLVGLSKPLESMSADIRLCHLKLRDVYGADPKRGAWESFKERNKYKDVEPAIHTLRSSISNNREKIMIWMQSINIGKLDFVYEDLMIKLTNLEKANEAAKALTHNVKRNEHFAIPKAVESHYLGRDIELSDLEEALWPKTQVQNHQQKRNVVYGVGGSGKTQLCGKYAQKFLNRYWGVFWIDGASEDRLKSSLISNVAEKGGVGKNHEAALHWLSNQDEDWLLIIDNADNPNVDLVDFFPQGANGHVLITTRNQDCTYGNIGSMAFSGMHESDTNELFVRVAKVAKSPENKQHMSDILKELGYLALAVVAGSTINQGYCTLEYYLTYLQRVWRGKLSERKSSGWSHNSEKAREGRVEAQFDLSPLAIKDRGTQAIKRCDKQDEIASKDAPELLKTFAYMHREKIRFRFLKVCAENARKERAQNESDTRLMSSTTHSWSQYLGQYSMDIIAANAIGKLDEDRFLRAMTYLRSYSLVSYDEETESWSMHPLIQRWAREGYEYNPGEHHVWCIAAATLISSCITLTEDSDGDEELMRQLWPHVDAVTERQDALNTRITENRLGRNKWYPIMDWEPKPHLLQMFAKFSKIYATVGQYGKADKLQRDVHCALETMRGYEDVRARGMTIFWARTLWALGKADEQANLLEKLLDNCMRIFGPDHRETHVASIKLADARLQQGRVIEARTLCDRSVPGLERLCSKEDKQTLDALNIHAMAIPVDWARIMSPDHVDTLESRQRFYAASFWDGDQDSHREAEQGMSEILELLEKKLVPEHPLTLLSMLYLARIKVELRNYDGAQKLFYEGLPIAERNLDKDHMGILFCRYHIGRMRVRQGLWREA
ncbi:hypothetical protein CFE70_009146 [Pyrenophora teres f. teres 0-1]|nr:hypothetical protein P3342_011040 [Pyrenophora teres f. teres]